MVPPRVKRISDSLVERNPQRPVPALSQAKRSLGRLFAERRRGRKPHRQLGARRRSLLGWRRVLALRREGARRIEQDQVIGPNQMEFFPRSFLRRELVPAGGFDREAQIVVLLCPLRDLQVEPLHLFPRVAQLQDLVVPEEEHPQKDRGGRERHEERHKRTRSARRSGTLSHAGNAFRPAKTPAGPSSSSMTRSRLYLARRSPRQAE